MTRILFDRFVASYLVSKDGADTPTVVANALFVLDTHAHGFERRLDVQRLHKIRVILQEIHEAEELHEQAARSLALHVGRVWRMSTPPAG